MIAVKSDICSTNKSVEFYKRYKDAFGEVVEAEMTKDDCYTLKLINKDHEEFVFEYGLTAGYGGIGCDGTLAVLRLAGFTMPDDIVINSETFKLKKYSRID